MKEIVIKKEWIYEWFNKQGDEKGEYVSGGTLDGWFDLDELAQFLTRKLMEE